MLYVRISKVFDQCMLPVISDGSETWSLTIGLIRRLKVTQEAMDRAHSLPARLNQKLRRSAENQGNQLSPKSF